MTQIVVALFLAMLTLGAIAGWRSSLAECNKPGINSEEFYQKCVDDLTIKEHLSSLTAVEFCTTAFRPK